MDIYLIRHTRTANRPGLCYGREDVALAAEAGSDIAAVLAKLPGRPGETALFSSPLSRCLQLARAFGENVKTDARLLELNFGDWENRFFNELDAGLVKTWADDFVRCAPPNGESFADLCRRASSFFRDLTALSFSAAIVVTHAGVIRALLAHILDLPPANAFRFRIDFGSVHKLAHRRGQVRIEYLNR